VIAPSGHASMHAGFLHCLQTTGLFIPGSGKRVCTLILDFLGLFTLK